MSDIPKEVKIDKSIFKYLAQSIQINMQKEADAIVSYQEMLNELQNYYHGEMDEESAKKYGKAKEIICKQIKEFIADELNHQEGLGKLYSFVTGIQANES